MNQTTLAPDTVERIIINGYDLTDYDQKERMYQTEVRLEDNQFGTIGFENGEEVEVVYFPAVSDKGGSVDYIEYEAKRYTEYDCMKYVATKLDPRHESYDKDAGEYWVALPHIRIAKHEYERI